MTNDITCPKCGNTFDVEDVIAADIEKKYQQKYKEQSQELLNKVEADRKKFDAELLQFEEKKKRENELFAQKLQQEKLKLETELNEQLRKSIASDYENKLRILQNNNDENEEKLKEARKKELDFLQKEQVLKNKEAELEITLQKKLQEERSNLTEQIRKQEAEKNSLKENEFQLKLREMEKQLDDQKKLAEEMKRKADQGSVQLQGEVQELILEELLRANFPFDIINEVGKGIKGADCIQTIRNNKGQECGKIIFESKRTKDFSAEWIEKLKVDMRNVGANIAVIVTQSMPKDMERFGEKNGVYICTFVEVIALVKVLRNSILDFFLATVSQENKGEKMSMLYSYLTSREFAEQWNAIREGFTSMRISIQSERDAMEMLWKKREKQLEKVLLNAAHIRGSVEGIAGSDSVDLNLLDKSEGDNLLEN